MAALGVVRIDIRKDLEDTHGEGVSRARDSEDFEGCLHKEWVAFGKPSWMDGWDSSVLNERVGRVTLPRPG